MKVTTTPGLEVALERECLAFGWAPRRIKGGVELPESLRGQASRLRTATRIDGGELLYRRGYRQEIGRAPLRETLAAGLLILSGYDGKSPLVDPMCGSGTIAIEAALMGTGPVFASDVNAGAVGIARRNARRAGVTIQLARLDVEAVRPPPGPGFIVTNPPYGKRVGGETAALEALARALAKNFEGWRAGILAQGRPELPLVDVERFRIKNGGLSCELLVGTVRP